MKRPHASALFLAAINVILLMKPAALHRLSFNGTIDETIPLSSASSLGMRHAVRRLHIRRLRKRRSVVLPIGAAGSFRGAK
jgi:hypothetical protein